MSTFYIKRSKFTRKGKNVFVQISLNRLLFLELRREADNRVHKLTRGNHRPGTHRSDVKRNARRVKKKKTGRAFLF